MDEVYRGRRAYTSLVFNGQNVTERLREYLESVTFTDVASGSSDSVNIQLNDRDGDWIGNWYPTKGDSIQGGAFFRDWFEVGDSYSISYGIFVLDSIKFSGNPSRASFGGMAIPQDQSFKTRQRTKTWENVTLQQIGNEIAGRYGMTCQYNADAVQIESLEQTDKTDSDFLYSTCKDYCLKMKVYNKKIVIFDCGRMEAKAPVAAFTRQTFVNDAWDYSDELEGTYTGAIIKYKSSDSSGDDGEISVTVGNADEDSPKARVLYINTKVDNEADAIRKAKAKVNEANESATKLSGTIWGFPRLASGVTVTVKGMGHANGKYYVEKVTTQIGSAGTSQKVEMHKVYKRL